MLIEIKNGIVTVVSANKNEARALIDYVMARGDTKQAAPVAVKKHAPRGSKGNAVRCPVCDMKCKNSHGRAVHMAMRHNTDTVAIENKTTAAASSNAAAGWLD